MSFPQLMSRSTEEQARKHTMSPSMSRYSILLLPLHPINTIARNRTNDTTTVFTTNFIFITIQSMTDIKEIASTLALQFEFRFCHIHFISSLLMHIEAATTCFHFTHVATWADGVFRMVRETWTVWRTILHLIVTKFLQDTRHVVGLWIDLHAKLVGVLLWFVCLVIIWVGIVHSYEHLFSLQDLQFGLTLPNT